MSFISAAMFTSSGVCKLLANVMHCCNDNDIDCVSENLTVAVPVSLFSAACSEVKLGTWVHCGVWNEVVISALQCLISTPLLLPILF